LGFWIFPILQRENSIFYYLLKKNKKVAYNVNISNLNMLLLIIHKYFFLLFITSKCQVLKLL
jgi:hypothetical protein